MFNWKAILPGLIVTLFVGLFCLLVFTIVASKVGSASDDSFIAAHRQTLWFSLAILTVCISMFIGGVVTTLLSKEKGLYNSICVGALAGILSIFVSSSNSSFTFMSIFILFLGIFAAAIGSRVCNN
jgi:hypothetical protein